MSVVYCQVEFSATN